MTAHTANEPPDDHRSVEPGDALPAGPRPRRWGARRFVLALVAVTWAAPGIARADDEAAAASIARSSHRALEDYENLDFDGARRRLSAALEECSRSGLSWHAVAAEAHVLMGVVLLAQGDRLHAEAVAEFQKALEIQPAITVPERVANPEIQRVFKEASTAAPRERPPAEPPAAARPQADTRAPATDEKTDDESEVAEEESEPEMAGAPGAHTWVIGLSAGGGLGWASGSGEVTDTKVASGFHAASIGHLLPEVGYFVAPAVLLSVQLRVQFITGATSEVDPGMTMCGSDHVCSPSHGATAVFAKATWFLRERTTFRPFLSGVIGAGQIRHLASVQGATMCGTDAAHPVSCVDTVVSGPVFVGAGAGVALRLNRNFSLVASANPLLGFPRFTFHIDVNGGVALEF